MSRRMLVNIPILLLLSAFSFIALRYFFSLNISAPVLENQEQNLLQELKKEKIASQRLNARNARLRAYLKSAHKKIGRSFAVLGSLGKTEAQLDKLSAQYSILKSENSALLAEKSILIKENEALRVKLNSAEQPKNTVKEVKPEVKKEGNRGVLFKAKPASTPRVRIEVIPGPIQK